MALTFNAFIAGAPASDTSMGDFIADAKEDVNFPDVAAWAEVRDYLKATRAGRAAIRAALEAWKSYEVARDADV
jgi:hypothetical protein